jgi:hypothetical protein
MGIQTLKKGYTQLLNFIYSKSQYYERVKTFLKEYQVPSIGIRDITKDDIGAFFKSIWKLGIVEQGRRYYWKLILKNLFLYPKKFPMAVTLAIYGLHFRKVTQKL